jgi:hypothetical protein
MSKDKLIQRLDTAFDNGTPFIDYTDYYIYCLIPQPDGNWLEVSYDIASAELDERTINSTIAFRMLIEEIEKGISMEIEDFMLNNFKDFRKSIEDKPEGEKAGLIIKELTLNTQKYSTNLPIINAKDKLDGLKSKIK